MARTGSALTASVSVALQSAERAALEQLAESNSSTLSQIARRVLRRGLMAEGIALDVAAQPTAATASCEHSR